MQERVKPTKRAVSLSIDAGLLDAANARGTDLSSVLERALRESLQQAHWQEWREKNRVAIDASNRELAENGLWCDEYRIW